MTSKIEHKILKLKSKTKNPRFREKHDWLCQELERICENWIKYLTQYVDVTGDLLNAPEVPWEQNERVLVSTLAASIMRANADAIIAEELPVNKGSSVNGKGRCDLWAHIPDKKGDDFNFYMEAKKFKRHRTLDGLKEALAGGYGIRRMFDDYAKARGGKIRQNSPYSKTRRHSHFVIGMIAVPLVSQQNELFENIDSLFEEIFFQRQIVDSKQDKDKHRIMGRFPTIGFCIKNLPSNKSSLFISLTVLGG